jgi:hypothetical protein
MVKYYQGLQDAEFWTAFDHALQYGHTDAMLQPVIVEMAYRLWPTLSAQRQQAVSAMVAGAKQPLQTRLREKAKTEGVVLSN